MMNYVKKQILPFDTNATILEDYDFDNSFINHGPNTMIKYYKLREYSDVDYSANMKLFNTFGNVIWSFRIQSTSNKKETEAKTLENDKNKIIRHLHCNGIMKCDSSACSILNPAPTTAVKKHIEYKCGCGNKMTFISYTPCSHKVALWMVCHNDVPYGAVHVGPHKRSHELNTICNNLLNKNEYELLKSLIVENRSGQNTRE